MSNRPGVYLYFDRVVFLDRLSDEQNGKILRAIICYARDGNDPEFNDQTLLLAWDFLRPALDEDAVKYEAKCERNRQNAVKRWHANASDRMPNTNPNSKTEQNQSQPQTQRNDLERARELLKQMKEGGKSG